MMLSPQPPATGAELLALERQARLNGTGLGLDELCGCWWLQQVWPRGGQQASASSGWLLRAMAARLEIDRDGEALQVSNAVGLGALELRFHGHGSLQGRRPLLFFQFERLEIILGGRTLLQRSLQPAKPRRLPFFALIHRDPSGWLAARGRGGGLALWQLAASADGVTDRQRHPTSQAASS